jgi:hypothetical protein
VSKSMAIRCLLAVLALALLGAGCGSDDEDQGTDTVASASTKDLIPVLSGADKPDPRGAKVSDSGVYLCSSIDTKGVVGHIAYDGFHDISVRGISCKDGYGRIVETFRSWDGTATAETVDGYACTVLYQDDTYATIRCAQGDDRAYRFTVQRESRPSKPKRPKEVVTACGAFGRYYDISARDLDCRATQSLIDGGATIDALKPGQRELVDGYTCTVLYVQANEHTVRCVDGSKAVRVSVAQRVQPHVPKKPVVKEDETFVHKPSGTTSEGLNNRLVTPCAPSGEWDAITAKGVSCETVGQTLTAAGQALVELAKDAQLSEGTFACKRVDTKPGQAPTVSCQQQIGVSFRASLIPGAQDAGASTTTTTTTTTTATTPTDTTTTP